MKKVLIFLTLSAFILPIFAQKNNATYLAYIEAWRDVAVMQQTDFGIPASITMAQALLESGAGQSELAVKANNHFGIKCTSDWFGGVYYHNDETDGECFRQYRDAGESFKDHSIFLQRPRYTTCFEIAIEDYEGWAHRLRECGYATDRLYAQKLIKIIEDYRLDTLANAVGKNKKPAKPSKPATTQQQQATQQQTGKTQKAAVVHRTEPIMVIHNDPEPPYVAPLTAKQERDSFFLMHPKKRYNNVPYVVAREGDTYSNVAFRLNVKERDLREDNDALGRELQKGDRIYLSPKRSQGLIDQPFVWTKPGLSIWQLSQDEAVTVESIQRWNELDPSVRVFRSRQKIYLRKVREENYDN